VEVGFSSATAGNGDWTGDSVAGSFEEAGTPGVVGAEADLEAAEALA
jgi:hypothetical protein